MNLAAQPLVVDLPLAPLTRELAGRRVIYSQVSVEDGRPDREGEIVAVDALWDSRELFLEQGDLDIAHWAHLPNPLTGRPDLEYRIGVPIAVKRDRNSIYIRGEIFTPEAPPLEGSSAERADLFWAALHRMHPPARYYPSVFGTIKGVEIVMVDDKPVRRITGVEWRSVGFHNKVQHPNVPPVSLDPLGPFAKADGSSLPDTTATLEQVGGLRLTLGQLAKALTIGLPVQTDTGARTGAQALMRESLDGDMRSVTTPAGERVTYLRHKKRLLERIHAGEIAGTRSAIKAALIGDGLDESQAEVITKRFLTDLGRTLHPGGTP